MNVAEKRRNIPQILFLHTFNKLLKIPKKLSKINEDITDLLFYPKIEDLKTLANIMNRVTWYLPNHSNLKINIFSEIRTESINFKELVNSLPEYYHSFMRQDIVDTINIIDNNIEETLESSNLILIWDKSALKDPTIIKYLSKVAIVDPTFYSHTESSFYRELNYKCMSRTHKENNYKNYIEKFKNLQEIASQYKDGTVFGSGPSLEKATNHNFENSFTIVCNSIVKNKKLLEHIRPNVIVFADPVLHFGVSKYSYEFRKHLAEAVIKYEAYCIVPEHSAELVERNMPSISKYIIGIPTNANKVTFPTESNFTVKSSSNILTLLMLPIASALFKKINIIGSDGREKNEKSFWKHSSASQFNDLMETVYKSHPSFFRDRIYTDYYRRHVKYLEEIISAGEMVGKEYFSLEDSFIEVLQERRINNG